ELLGDRAAQIRLAEAGDRVDFVVNLALGPEGAKGRLERETARGTVAIREVEDLSCEKVAQVVALNLSLALEPGVPEPAPEPEATAEKGAQDPSTKGPDPSKQTSHPQSDATSPTRRAEKTNARD